MSSAVIIATDNGFRLQGEVSFDNVVDLRFQGEKMLASDSRESLVIDLSDMKDQDASPVSLLLCWIRFASQKNKMKLNITHRSQSLLRMQTMFGVTWIN